MCENQMFHPQWKYHTQYVEFVIIIVLSISILSSVTTKLDLWRIRARHDHQKKNLIRLRNIIQIEVMIK